MKFAIIALLLGCAVIVFPFAAESKFLSTRMPMVARFSQVPAQTACPWLICLVPSGNTPPPVPIQGRSSEEPAVRLPSKTETLALIADAAAKYQVPEAFVTSIVAAESNFDCAAISQKGAIGLMQLMPETAQQFSADATVPAQNIDAGTHYLRWLVDRYRKNSNSIRRVIAAYNAGPGMVDRYRGVPPFPETRNYVKRVLGFLKQYSPPQKHHDVARRNRRGQNVDEWADYLAMAGRRANGD
jgi:soluble lytic murein transglycosylase-like protein